MRRFNPEKELYKIQHGNRNKILYIVLVLLLIISIGSTYALYQVRYNKRIIYTKVAPFSNHDLDLAVYVDDVKKENFPENVGTDYVFERFECKTKEITSAKWDYEKKGLSVLTMGPNQCDVYFSKRTELDFSYNVDIQEYTFTKAGYYKLEVWGASSGGLGGYSYGSKFFDVNDKIYIVIGGSGASGGYNGGVRDGGGATHIATESGVLSSLSSKQDSVLLVAGGGGSGSRGGAGGGAAGGGASATGNLMVNGKETTVTYACDGAGPTYGGRCWGQIAGNNASYYAYASFGLAICDITCGGGGWYEGSAAGYSPGSGGSGHVSSLLEEAATIAGQNSGDGKAKITYVGNNL